MTGDAEIREALRRNISDRAEVMQEWVTLDPSDGETVKFTLNGALGMTLSAHSAYMLEYRHTCPELTMAIAQLTALCVKLELPTHERSV